MEPLTRRKRERESREKEIIAAAAKAFSRNRYEGASMDEIAKEAQFTKRTLYQHFENKDDLFFAVALQEYQKLAAVLREEIEQGGTGYEKLEQGCKRYYQFFKENRNTFRMLNAWWNTRSNSDNSSKYKKALIEFVNQLLLNLEDILSEGIYDGSIQLDTDAKRAAYSLGCLINGFYCQMCAMEDTLKIYETTNDEDFCMFSIDFVIKPLKRTRPAMAARKGTAR